MTSLCAYAPLGRFTSKVDNVEFGNGVSLRHLTDEETKGVFSWFGIPAAVGLGFDRFALTYDQDSAVEGASDVDLQERVSVFGESQFRKVESALRLAHRGGVYCAMKVSWYDPPDQVPEYVRWPFRTLFARSGLSLPQYVLDDGDVERVRDLIPRLDSAPANVAVALRRFNQGYERSEPADRIIDHWIALEALFSDESDSVSYRTCLRMSRYIGRNAFQRRQVFNFGRIAYSIRSGLVHGLSEAAIRKRLNRPMIGRATERYGFSAIRECAGMSEDWLRVSLLRAIRSGKRPDLVQLDMEAVSEGKEETNADSGY